MEYNLEDRTIKFSKKVIEVIKKIGLNAINKSIVSQLVRSATSERF